MKPDLLACAMGLVLALALATAFGAHPVAALAHLTLFIAIVVTAELGVLGVVALIVALGSLLDRRTPP